MVDILQCKLGVPFLLFARSIDTKQLNSYSHVTIQCVQCVCVCVLSRSLSLALPGDGSSCSAAAGGRVGCCGPVVAALQEKSPPEKFLSHDPEILLSPLCPQHRYQRSR